MRLLDARTVTLTREDTYGVRYAILSHRWGHDDDEVSFADIQTPNIARRKKGYSKIKRCCEQALKDGFDYVWVDTCCIYKDSSTELQESINSMYRWYEEAGVCYAYLQDVPSRSVQNSEWFTRGWTLQELLAPKVVKFFDGHWEPLGDQRTLLDTIHQATGIGIGLLLGMKKLQDFSIAERMSWASKRKTTRIEDRAYSLFGIFQVNLPMLYGEREMAFHRLQEAILNTRYDNTLLAWTGVSRNFGGLLAPRLEAFEDSARFRTHDDSANLKVSGMTPRGLSVTANLYPLSTDTYVVFIGCLKRPDKERQTRHGIVGIFVRALQEDDEFARISFKNTDLLYLSQGDYKKFTKQGEKDLRSIYKPEVKMSWMMNRSISIRQTPLLQEHEYFLGDWVEGTFRASNLCSEYFRYMTESSHSDEPADSRKDGGQKFDFYIRDLERRMISRGPKFTISAIDPRDQTTIAMLKPKSTLLVDNMTPKIQEIYLGLDHYFNPTLVIRKQGMDDSPETCDLDWLEIEQQKGKTRHWLTRLFRSSRNHVIIQEANFWNKTEQRRGGKIGKTIVLDHSDRNFWAVRGDRRCGVDVHLSGKVGLRVRLERCKSDDGLVWQLELGTQDISTYPWLPC